MKDKNDNFVKLGDSVTDEKGVAWKLENINGVTFACRYTSGRRVQTIPHRKIDFNKLTKVS